jgi:protocatechuate 3,4-dioxygenase beta subunit
MLRQTILGALILAVPFTAAAGQEVQQSIRINMGGGEGAPMSVLPPGREPKVGTSVLRGRVVAADTGSALRRAQVRISSPDIGTKTALTDAQGRFEFKTLPAGRFNVSVTKSGFVAMQFGQSRPFEPGRPIELADAAVMDKADVALPRGSVLAGRVVDEFGEAVADADVMAMRLQFQNGRRRLVPSGRNASTNDLGQFRLYGLPPGEYYVSATLRNMTTMMLDMPVAGAGFVRGGDQPQTSGYASTYYPSSPNPGEAQRVSVAVGQELSTVDIQLQPVKLARITGMALASDGKPMSGAMVMLMPSMRDAMLFSPGGTSRTDKDGNFTLSGVTPGEYSLQVQSMGGIFQSTAGGNVMAFAFATADASGAPGQNAPQQREFGVATLNVAGEDIGGLVITGMRGAKASGTVSYGAAAKPDGTGTIRVTSPATDVDGNPMPSFGAGTVNAETGAFTIENLVGGHTFRAANLPRGWVLKRVTYNGEDITDRGLEFKPGADIEGVEIELTNKTSAVNGTVNTASGQPAKDYTVVVFPEDQQKWVLAQNRWMASTRPDQEGQFRFNSLPPGDYFAVAVEYVAAGEWQDPAWLERAAKTATKFTLDEGATKTLQLKLAGS